MHKVEYGTKSIPFTIELRPRRTISISVLPDRSVHVLAPEERTIAEITKRVQRRAGWISRRQDEFETFMEHQPPREYVSGETHRYLGRQYLLKVQGVEDNSVVDEGVKLRGAFIYVSTSEPGNPVRVRSLLEGWYRRKAMRKFSERLEECHPLVRRHGIAMPTLIIRSMTTRWGSCTASGRIILNPKLIQAPTHCIDYVIVHELCHLKHADHGPAFYCLLESVLPEWRLSKQRLEQVQW